jgi:NADPH:quinone reductase-like Zn-dependent oxidoreductase
VIWQWAADAKTRPYVHGELALADTLVGFRMLENREVVGKLVIRPDL